MLSITRSLLRPSLARSYAARATASLHTLPELPYAYDVGSQLFLSKQNNHWIRSVGVGASHFGGNYEASSPETSSNICQWT